MKFMATNVLTMDDWIVTFDLVGGKRIVKGVSPKMDEDKAIELALAFLSQAERDNLVHIKAVRRRDRLEMDQHPEVTRRLSL